MAVDRARSRREAVNKPRAILGRVSTLALRATLSRALTRQ
jgi:hypothetical protein